MIACISPGSSSADHSLNTLRYADRLKDNSEMHKMLN
jgi:kinesin family protein 2/24